MRSRILLFLAGVAASGCSSTAEPKPETPAIITVGFEGRPADTMYVYVSRAETITAAESYVATHHGPKLIAGTIVRGAGIDLRYPFQFVPESVQLLDAAVQACDAAPMHTEAAVNDFFAASIGKSNAPAATWCPWSSYPIAVLRLRFA